MEEKVLPEALYEKLKIEKVLHCDPSQSELISECGFGLAYDWLARQMAIRIVPPPEGVQYPFWAWHTIEWKHKKPDLRRTAFSTYSSGNQVCLELDIPDDMVLLSNEDSCHIILNDMENVRMNRKWSVNTHGLIIFPLKIKPRLKWNPGRKFSSYRHHLKANGNAEANMCGQHFGN